MWYETEVAMKTYFRLILFLSAACLVMAAGFAVRGRSVVASPASSQLHESVPPEDWFARQRAFPYDEVPLYARQAALEVVRRSFAKVPDGALAQVAWTFAGPSNIEGRITAVAIHPNDPNTVYVGSANGGVWKSTDFCASWTGLFDNMNTQSIGSLAIDPKHPEVVYCGTGEANSLRSAYPGAGLYKSTDGGQSWTLSGLSASYSIAAIAINPQNTSELYAAVLGAQRKNTPERGVYKSTDAGASWSQSLYISDSCGAVDVVIDQQHPNRVFAGTWERTRRESYIKYGGPESALYLSTDAGASWTVLKNGFPSDSTGLGRISIDVSASNPNIVYALAAYADGSSQGLYTSTDGGASWAFINNMVGSSDYYAYFNRVVRVHPANPNELYCGGMWMEHSTDGGMGFDDVPVSHVDSHAFAFAPSNHNFLVTGNDGGVDFSTDGGASWNNSSALPVTEFYAGTIHPRYPTTIFGGSQDNGVLITYQDRPDAWMELWAGDGMVCAVDSKNTQNWYVSTEYAGFAWSTDGGTSFYDGTGGLQADRSNWVAPLALDKRNPSKIYCGTYRIFRSTDHMLSWYPMSKDLTNGAVQNLGTITTIDVAQSDTNVVYCGTDDANVWVTRDGAKTWTKINSGLPYLWVTRVTVDPDSANICYVTLSGYKVDLTGAHVFRTTDYGASWTSISGNLPDAPINDVVVYPDDRNVLFIGTDVGVFYTTNLGVNWYRFGTGMPVTAVVMDLSYDAASRELVAWTHGRSAWKTILPAVLSVERVSDAAAEFALRGNYPNPFAASTEISFSLAAAASVSLTIYDERGAEVRRLLAVQNCSAGTWHATWNGRNTEGMQAENGIYFYRLTTSSGLTATKKMVLLR
jgi:photosystem II stability/assembly factor-like uncharacterized protein